MDLRNKILQEHNKNSCLKIVNWIGNDLLRFNELFDLFLHGEYRIAQRSAWPLGYCAIAHPEFLKNNFKQLIDNLKKPGIHNSIKRNTVRMLQEVEIPERYEGRIMEICFNYVQSRTEEAVAIKAF
jgi:hypothetical protein